MLEYDKKEFGILIILLIGAIITGILAITYSRFFVETKTDSSDDLVGWVVKVGNDKITKSSHVFTFDEIVVDGKVAFSPGTIATLPISIDAREVDTDYDYEIKLSDSYKPFNKAIVVKNLPFKGTISTKSNIVDIDEVKLEWKKLEDTDSSINTESFKIPIEIKLTKHVKK